jgi:excisionase family DNA binding protein
VLALHATIRGDRNQGKGRVSELLTLRQAADRLGCSTATIKRRVRVGSLPAFRDGRLVRIREDDLRRYVAERVARTVAGGRPIAPGMTLAAGARLWD